MQGGLLGASTVFVLSSLGLGKTAKHALGCAGLFNRGRPLSAVRDSCTADTKGEVGGGGWGRGTGVDL